MKIHGTSGVGENAADQSYVQLYVPSSMHIQARQLSQFSVGVVGGSEMVFSTSNWGSVECPVSTV
jgi:hypothetical protein